MLKEVTIPYDHLTVSLAQVNIITGAKDYIKVSICHYIHCTEVLGIDPKHSLRYVKLRCNDNLITGIHDEVCKHELIIINRFCDGFHPSFTTMHMDDLEAQYGAKQIFISTNNRDVIDRFLRYDFDTKGITAQVLQFGSELKVFPQSDFARLVRNNVDVR